MAISVGNVLNLSDDNKLICSEAVARILYDASEKDINFELEYCKNYNLITPMDIFESKYVKNIK